MKLSQEWPQGDDTLRKFGLALVRDGGFIADDVAAEALVNRLIRQAGLSLLPASGVRVALYGQFIRLYRRRLRKALAEDEAPLAPPTSFAARARRSENLLQGAVSRLPLELRECLLLVVLGEFSHIEAAQALDIPLTTLFERISRARDILSVDAPPAGAELRPAPPAKAAPYLRLVT